MKVAPSFEFSIHLVISTQRGRNRLVVLSEGLGLPDAGKLRIRTSTDSS